MYVRKIRLKYRRSKAVAAAVIAAAAALVILAAIPQKNIKTAEKPQTITSIAGSLVPHREGKAKIISIGVFDGSDVKQMDIEEYVLSATAGEMPAAFESEALKAQAVAARTFAFRRLSGSGCNRAEGADVCTSSSHCQAFASLDKLKKRWGGRYDMYLEKISKAVEATRGIILTYGGKPIEALYFSSSGGKTEDAANVFGSSRPYLVSVDGMDSEDPDEDEVTVLYDKAQKKLESVIGRLATAPGELKKIVSIKGRNESGRVSELAIGNKTITGKEARKLFGLKSTNFTISFSSDAMIFKTRGYGHGVGMSQYGANEMAISGASFEEILSHYYPGTQTENIEK